MVPVLRSGTLIVTGLLLATVAAKLYAVHLWHVKEAKDRTGYVIG
jgi:uracil phosphoribosyltransferase